MIVKLTIEQKDSLVGTKFDGVQFFNPIQDINDNWVVSEMEVNLCNLKWLKDLTLEVYEPKPIIDLFI